MRKIRLLICGVSAAAFLALGDPVWAHGILSQTAQLPQTPASQHPSLPPRPTETRPQVASQVPWGPLVRRMWPVTLTYFCYGWSLWLYLNWLPLFFKNNYSLDIKNSALFASGAVMELTIFQASVFRPADA